MSEDVIRAAVQRLDDLVPEMVQELNAIYDCVEKDDSPTVWRQTHDDLQKGIREFTRAVVDARIRYTGN